jgi:hypothetical protein
MQTEAMQEIEERGIVTHKEAHENHADIRLQGDKEMHTVESLMARKHLKTHPALKAIVLKFWNIFDDDDSGALSHDEYITLNKLLHKALLPDVTEEEAKMSAETDWHEDCNGEETMDFDGFFSSMFQLADIWCEDIDGAEYEGFLKNLLNQIMAKGLVKGGDKKLRSMSEVDCVVAIGLEKEIKDQQRAAKKKGGLKLSNTQELPSCTFNSHHGWGKSSQWTKLRFAILGMSAMDSTHGKTEGSTEKGEGAQVLDPVAKIELKMNQAKKAKIKKRVIKKPDPLPSPEIDEYAPLVYYATLPHHTTTTTTHICPFLYTRCCSARRWRRWI